MPYGYHRSVRRSIVQLRDVRSHDRYRTGDCVWGYETVVVYIVHEIIFGGNFILARRIFKGIATCLT